MGRLARAAVSTLALVMAACGGGGGGGAVPSPAPVTPTTPTPTPPTTYVVQGLVNGLAEGSTLTLLLNGQPALSVARNGEFRLAQAFRSGDSYQLSVAAPAGAVAQTCSVQGGAGTIAGDVSNVVVACSTLLFKLGGQVSGLRSGGLVLRSLRGDELTVAADGRFEFVGTVPSGASFGVLIAQQPGGVPAQTCTVSQGSGIVAAADINDVAVVCATHTYRVGGTVEGLRGLGLQLQLNGDAVLAREANGSFVFEPPLASASGYLVTVKAQPVGPAQTCSVADGSGAGVVERGDALGVRVVCSTNSYTVGGMVEGLVGSGLVLRNNGADDLPVASNGFFAFPQKVASGGDYTISVRSHPDHPRQTCSVSAGFGQITFGEAVGARVACSTLDYPLTVDVRGLRTDRTGGLVLRNNGTDDLPIDRNGLATFRTRLVSDAAYAVTVARQPTSTAGTGAFDTCAVSPGTASGTIDPDVPAIVLVDCAPATNAIVAHVSGLEGTGLRVKDTVGGMSRAFAADGDFLLDGYPPGSGYRFVIDGQPPGQSCFVANGEGTVGDAQPLPFVHFRCGPSAGLAMLMVNGSSGAVELHVRRENGAWEYLTFAPTGGVQPEGMVLSPSRRYVYVSNLQSRSIATFELDPVAGTLRRIGLTSTETSPWRLHMHPSGRFLYASSIVTSGIQVFSIDPVSGLPTSNGAPNVSGANMVLDAAGRFGQIRAEAGWYYSFEIDATSGAILRIPGEVPNLQDLFFFLGNPVLAPSGNYLLAGSQDEQTRHFGIALQRRDPASGLMLGRPERPQLLGFDDGRSVVSLALSPTGRYMAFVRQDQSRYPLAFGDPTIHFAAIDPVTGRVTYSAALGQLVAEQRLPGASADGWYLTFDPSEKFVYASRQLGGQVKVYAVDPEEGSIRLSGSIDARSRDGAFPAQANRTLVFELRPETAAQARARLRKPAASSRALKAPERAP